MTEPVSDRTIFSLSVMTPDELTEWVDAAPTRDAREARKVAAFPFRYMLHGPGLKALLASAPPPETFDFDYREVEERLLGEYTMDDLRIGQAFLNRVVLMESPMEKLPEDLLDSELEEDISGD